MMVQWYVTWRTFTFARGMFTRGPIGTLTLVLTPTAILATWTRLVTPGPHPARGAKTRAVTWVTVGKVVTGAHVVTPGTIRVDGTRAVAVDTRVAWLADTLPSPGVASAMGKLKENSTGETWSTVNFIMLIHDW